MEQDSKLNGQQQSARISIYFGYPSQFCIPISGPNEFLRMLLFLAFYFENCLIISLNYLLQVNGFYFTSLRRLYFLQMLSRTFRPVLNSNVLRLVSAVQAIEIVKPFRRFYNHPLPAHSLKPSPTSWLDGLRGYAALFVSLYHLRNGYTDSVHLGYKTGDGDTNLLQLPIVRLIFGGEAMVAIFFLVSGYSLSWGCFKDIQSGNPAKCRERILSSLFRRAFRLYLPTLASAFLAFICISLGLYDKGRDMDTRSCYREPEPDRFPTFSGQLGDWLLRSYQFFNVWQTDDNRHLYYPNSWTIPVEFKCSILLYVGILAISRLRLVPRAVAITFFILYCHWTEY